jgi:hypothetical protein
VEGASPVVSKDLSLGATIICQCCAEIAVVGSLEAQLHLDGFALEALDTDFKVDRNPPASADLVDLPPGAFQLQPSAEEFGQAWPRKGPQGQVLIHRGRKSQAPEGSLFPEPRGEETIHRKAPEKQEEKTTRKR